MELDGTGTVEWLDMSVPPWLLGLCIVVGCKSGVVVPPTPSTPKQPRFIQDCAAARGQWAADLEHALTGFARVRRVFTSAAQARAADDNADGALAASREGMPAIAVEIEKDLGDVLLVTNWGSSEPDPFESSWWSRLSLQLYVRRTDLVPVLTNHTSMVFDDATGYMIAPGAQLTCGDGSALRARVHGDDFDVPPDAAVGVTFEPKPMANGSGAVRIAGQARLNGSTIAFSPALAWVEVLEIGEGRYHATVSSPQMTLVFRVDQPDPPVNVARSRHRARDLRHDDGRCLFRAGTRLFFADRRFTGRVARPFTMPDAFEIREHPRGNLRCSARLAPDVGELCFFRSELGCL